MLVHFGVSAKRVDGIAFELMNTSLSLRFVLVERLKEIKTLKQLKICTVKSLLHFRGL